MSPFQERVSQRILELGRSLGIEWKFTEVEAHACARFVWSGKESLILVGDGELILEYDGEHYFDVPVDPESPEVRRFVAFTRMCLQGVEPTKARRQSRKETLAS